MFFFSFLFFFENLVSVATEDELHYFFFLFFFLFWFYVYLPCVFTHNTQKKRPLPATAAFKREKKNCKIDCASCLDFQIRKVYKMNLSLSLLSHLKCRHLGMTGDTHYFCLWGGEGRNGRGIESCTHMTS